MGLIRVAVRELVRETWKRERIDTQSPMNQIVDMSESGVRALADAVTEKTIKKFSEWYTGERIWPKTHGGITPFFVSSGGDEVYVHVTVMSDWYLEGAMRSPVMTGGYYTPSDVPGLSSEVHLDVYIQQGTPIDDELIETQLRPALRKTVRHELQHHHQSRIPNISSRGRRQKRYVNLRDSSKEIDVYFRHPKEIDAYVTELFEDQMRRTYDHVTGTFAFEPAMRKMLNVIRCYMTSSGFPADVIRHELKRIERKWTGYLRSKYSTSPVDERA